MPRSPRVFVEGGIYHVYDRVTRGECVFAEDAEAKRLLDTMREIKQRDGLIVLAWCIMGNHYHLAVRCTSVPLWRSMASIHSKISRNFNARNRMYGPFWQGRYKAKLVEEPDYLRKLVLYIHLNPVTAGIVDKPKDFFWCGHRELVRKVRKPLVDSDQLLLIFGQTRDHARRNYLQSIRASRDEPWTGARPGGLPWWRFGREPKEVRNDGLMMDRSTPYIDELGRSTALVRPLLSATDFVDRGLAALNVDIEEMAGRTKKRKVVRARELLTTLAVERYGLRVTEISTALNVRYDTASLWGRRGANRRANDRGFLDRIDEIDAILASSPPSEPSDLQKQE